MEFFNFCKLKDELPSLEDILKDPENASIPAKPSHRYAISSYITEGLEKHTDVLMKYLLRMPMEYQYLVIRMGIKQFPAILNNPQIDQWVTSNAERFYGN